MRGGCAFNKRPGAFGHGTRTRYPILRGMHLRRNPGTAVSLLLAAHPTQGALIALGVAGAALASGRALREVGLVFVTVLLGRVTFGWLNDVVDRDRDAAVDRANKPVAKGWVHPSTVTFSVAVATCLLVPLSIANGTWAGIAHLLAVVTAWSYNSRIKLTVLSPLPWALSFALLPAFLSYGGWGGGEHGGPPTITMTVLAGLLGIGIHVLTSLPDLVDDHATGVGSAPVRIALAIGAPRLLMLAGTATALVVATIVVASLTVGLTR